MAHLMARRRRRKSVPFPVVAGRFLGWLYIPGLTPRAWEGPKGGYISIKALVDFLRLAFIKENLAGPRGI